MTTRLAITPPNSLLVISGANYTPPPLPDGVATVFASDDTILVMTRYSDLGPTDVTVTIEPDSAWPSAGLRQVFDGELRSPGGIVELQNIHLESYGVFDVGADSVGVRVAIDRDLEPLRIDIAFDARLARDIHQR